MLPVTVDFKRELDGEMVFWRMSVDQCQVLLIDFSCFKLEIELAVRSGVQSKNKDTACVLVKSMNCPNLGKSIF